jgi:hypothetical protein
MAVIAGNFCRLFLDYARPPLCMLKRVLIAELADLQAEDGANGDEDTDNDLRGARHMPSQGDQERQGQAARYQAGGPVQQTAF